MLMITFFYIMILTITLLLTFLTGLSYWFIPLWLAIGILSAVIFVVLTIGILYPFAKITKVNNKIKHFYISQLSAIILHILFRVKNVEIVNKENIPKDINYVLYPNHKTTYDAFVIHSIFKTQMGFAAKDSLYKIPVFSGWLESSGSLKINRENDRETLKEIIKGIRYIENGLSMTVFPEGTRTRDTSKMKLGRAGAYRLATKAKVPVVPVALIGTNKLNKEKKRFFQTIKVVVGKPLYYGDYKNLTTTEIGNYVVDTVNGIIDEYEK